MDGVFAAGARLGEPVGDPARQAVATLRGFAYQLHASALAWLALADRETLHLEVAEDYAVAADDALRGVQVKDAAAPITIRSGAALAAIDSLVDLSARNPDRRASVRLLTTASIGLERAVADRVEDGPALAYWRRAAAGAPVAPLREVLVRLELAPATLAFLSERDDEALRRDLLRGLHFDAGQPPLGELAADLQAGCVEFASAALRLGADVGRRLAAEALAEVLRVATRPRGRSLRRADLIALAESVGMVSLPRATYERLAGASASSPREPLLIQGEPDPADGPITERRELVSSLAAAASTRSFALATASTGMGKTHAAARAAAATGGDWLVGDLHGLDAPTTAARLRGMAGEAAASSAAVVLLDDLDHADSREVRNAVARIVTVMRRRDGAVLATSASAPSRRTLAAICGSPDVVVEVPYLTVEEVGDLVEQAGGPRSTARLVHLAGSGGHPQLVQAAILHMRSAGWSRGAVRELLDGDATGIQDERRAARDRLVRALPEGARTLLLRASMVTGRLPRALALALADVDAPVANPGLELDRLLGPWIERTGVDRMRVSPLVQGAGAAVLSPTEQTAVHMTIADHLLRSGAISVSDGDALLHHALAGGEESQIVGYAHTLVTADGDTLELLARHAPAVIALRTDGPPARVRPAAAAMLRLGQLMVALSGDDLDRAAEVWRALRAEMTASGLEGFEVVVLSKILIATKIAGIDREWLDLLVRFDELCRTDERLRGWAEGAAMRGRRTPGLVQGFAFVHQTTALANPGELRSCLERLDAIAPDVRDRLFSGLRSDVGHFGHLVDGAWVRACKTEGFDAETAAGDFLAMATLALGWGEVELAARCHAARSVMLDEIKGNAAGALAALDEAERVLGPMPAISRARAKVHWRSRDHATALRELEEVWADPRTAGDKVERGFVAREAAISAAETGRWTDARRWFERSREAFEAFDSGSLPALRIGLGADAAQAAFRSGEGAEAIAGYARALEELRGIDAGASLAGGYLHRVVRHATLWLMAEARPERLDLAEAGALPPGACSNPEPAESILERPLGPLDLAWYLLADAALDLGETAFFDDLHSRLEEGPILGLEVGRRKRIADHAIATGDPARLAAAIAPYVAGLAHLVGHREELERVDVLRPERGEPAPIALDGSEPESARSAAADLALSFGMARAMAGDADALRRARASLDGPEVASILVLAKLMNGADGEPSDLARSIADVAAAGGDPVDPGAALAATARFALWARTSEFEQTLGPALAAWTRATWTRILARHCFRLRNPPAATPAQARRLRK